METEDNKIIAEFMQLEKTFKYNPKKIWLEYYIKENNSGSLYLPQEMQYDKSWDWLIPVIEKIETLGYKFEKNYQPIDKDWQSLIVKGNDILFQEFSENSLDSSCYVVVQFIKQYNNHFHNN